MKEIRNKLIEEAIALERNVSELYLLFYRLFPEGLLALKESNRKLIQLKEKFENHPDRNRAFQIAYEVENSAGELHYNNYMNQDAESRLSSIFRKLNGDDLNHADRIREYMRLHRIPVGD